MIICGLVGALVKSSYKWGYFVFGCAAFFAVIWTLTYTGRKHANFLGDDVGRVYTMTSVWTIFLWFIYPIAWGVSEGGNVIHPDSEAVFYGILDILAKPVFGALLLFGHRNIAPARLGLSVRDYNALPAGADSDITKRQTNPIPGEASTTSPARTPAVGTTT